MTIDVREIIFNLDIPLENVEWETLQNVKWGPLINETYDDIIESVGYFTNSATRILIVQDDLSRKLSLRSPAFR